MKKLFFLHVPKCAGMSLLRAVEQSVPRHELYQSTSMIVNWNENRPEFFQHSSFYKLRALFGHWLHEDMLQIVPGDFLLATSLRDPVSRIKSQFRFDIKRSRNSRFEMQDGTEFLKRNQDVICRFLCHAFPSISADYDTLARGALAVLSSLDFVYDSRDSERAVPLLFEELSWPRATLPRTNTSDDIDQAIDARDDDIRAAVANDLLLYETFITARAQNPESADPLFDPTMASRVQIGRKAPLKVQRLIEHLAHAYAQEIRHGGDPLRELRNIRWRGEFDRLVQLHLDKPPASPIAS